MPRSSLTDKQKVGFINFQLRMENWSSMSERQRSYGGFTGNSFGAIARRRLQKGWKMRESKDAWERKNGILPQ